MKINGVEVLEGYHPVAVTWAFHVLKIQPRRARYFYLRSTLTNNVYRRIEHIDAARCPDCYLIFLVGNDSPISVKGSATVYAVDAMEPMGA